MMTMPKSIVSYRNSSPTANDLETGLLSDDLPTPPHKNVRWQDHHSTSEEATGAAAEVDAMRRKRRLDCVPSNPNAPMMRSTKKRRPQTLEEVELYVQKLEAKIQKAARLELALLNQSKRLREKRQLLTIQYERMSQNMRELAEASNCTPSIATKSLSALPPMYKPKTRTTSSVPHDFESHATASF